MPVNCVNGACYAVRPQPYYGTAPVNPRHDKVFLDPKTGEYTTWKPGIIPTPEMIENNKRKRRLRFLSLVGLGVLAYVYRGKLKQGMKIATDFIKTLMKK